MEGLFIGLPLTVYGLFLVTSPYYDLRNSGIWMLVIGALCIAASIIGMISAYKSMKPDYKQSLQEFIDNDLKRSSAVALIISLIAGLLGLIFTAGDTDAVSNGGKALIFIAIVEFIVAFAGSSKNAAEAEKQDQNRKTQQNISFEESLIHLGGHPYLKQNEKVLFQIRNDKIYFNGYIDPKDIIQCVIKTEEDIRKDVTLTRLVALGIFAFAFKKEKKEIRNYIILSYKLNGTPIDCLLRG